jgi:hypothetical protein
MEITHPDAIWLIPPLLAVAFLLWVLWNFIQDEKKQHAKAHAAHPLLICSSANGDFRASSTAVRDVRNSGRAAPNLG